MGDRIPECRPIVVKNHSKVSRSHTLRVIRRATVSRPYRPQRAAYRRRSWAPDCLLPSNRGGQQGRGGHCRVSTIWTGVASFSGWGWSRPSDEADGGDVTNPGEPAPDPVTVPAHFRRLIAGWGASLTADGLRVVALPLLTASIDRSPSAVAAVAGFSALPWLVVAIPAGAFVDRTNPARAQAVAHLARAALTAVLAAVAIWHWQSIPLLCALGFCITSAETVADSAAQSLMVRTVPAAALERANARFVTVETVALDLVGPLAGGVLFTFANWLPFAVSGLLFVAAAVAVVPSGLPAGTGRVRPGRRDRPAPDHLGAARVGAQSGAADPGGDRCRHGVGQLRRRRPNGAVCDRSARTLRRAVPHVAGRLLGRNPGGGRPGRSTQPALPVPGC